MSESGTHRLLISYRRADSQQLTERFAERLAMEFGVDSVFLDTSAIPIGVQFERYIQSSLSQSQAVIAVIGPDWMGKREGDTDRIQDPEDPVRMELQWARERGVAVIPALLDGTKMPSEDELPEELHFLSKTNAVPIRSGMDFDFTVHRLIVVLQDDYGFPKRSDKTRLARILCVFGTIATVFGGLTSIGLVVEAVVFGDPRSSFIFEPSSMMLTRYSAMEIFGPLLLGAGVLVNCFAVQLSCRLNAARRRPSFLGVNSTTKRTHPDAQYALAFGIASVGWGILSYLLCIFFGVRGIRRIKKDQARFEGSTACLVAIGIGLLGTAISAATQSLLWPPYLRAVRLERIEESLEQGDLVDARRSAEKMIGSKNANHPRLQLALGKLSNADGEFDQALSHTDSAISSLGDIYFQERDNQTGPPLYYADLVEALSDAHVTRARAHENLGNTALAREDYFQAETLTREISSIATDSSQDSFEVAAPQRTVRLPEGDFTNSIGMPFVEIEAGKFMMGSHESAERIATTFGEDPNTFANEFPRREQVVEQSFMIGACEVTHLQFSEFVKSTGYRTEAEDGTMKGAATGVAIGRVSSWRNPDGSTPRANDPVAMVTYNDAMAFCRWLSQIESKTYRLPTDVEWEYTARAGTDTRYWNGDDPLKLTEVANVPDLALSRANNDDSYNDPRLVGKTWVNTDDGYPGLAPVGSFPANDWGLHDVHGNVWEWCTVADPSTLKLEYLQNKTVLRGGCLF